VSVEATLTLPDRARAQPLQNWILNPLQDTVFVVAAPLIVLAGALGAFSVLGAADAATYILLFHIVLTVAHHTPTFIRVYGDVDLFRRFKWAFIFGPLIPFCFALGVLGYLASIDYPVENALYLFILLTIWDPWHFLMQHYGFMRIYDRHNQAPRRIAARMDLALCVSWFVFIMLASGEWLVDLLEDMYLTARLPLVLLLPPGLLPVLHGALLTLASLATLAYGAYLVWCRHNGYFISIVKLALFATTFGVMFIAYTPNSWILSVAPGWTFKVGFAVLGIVHMTQYLAIVWRYNRSLAMQPQRARAGLFRKLHATGGWVVGSGYVALCLAYGAVLTTVHDNRWLMSVLIAAGFTSTLMHYYFDGFIWKIRHRQNREHLAAPPADGVDAGDRARDPSWWDTARRCSAPIVLLRQLVYFGLPMAVLTAGAVWVWHGPGANYVGQMMRGQLLYEQGAYDEALEQARTALESMDWQLPAAQRLAELDPTAAREAAVAFLIYNRSRYAEMLLPSLTGAAVTAPEIDRHRSNVAAAIEMLERALADGGSIVHAGREEIRREDAYRTLESWRRELGELSIARAP
jgi:tetratricopeptide (TPR) repeat protein